jgi:sulfide dehydrogenase [flavocytochrome c] flavoprotein chain
LPTLVVSPGVELIYDSIVGWGRKFEDVMPHAWQGRGQIALLKSKLDAVKDGELIVVIAPPDPYCCPPAPYERVTIMAYSLKKSGRQNSRIVVLDPKKRFSMQGLFEDSWESLYPGMVQWIDAEIYTSIDRVDPATNTVYTGFDTYKNSALVNVIPAQSAGAIARNAGLSNETGYCPIDPESMQSLNDPNIYVIGDACIGGDMPKSAFAANCQAKVAAAALHDELLGFKATAPNFESICWSTIDDGNAIKVTGSYQARGGKIVSAQSSVSQFGDSANLREANQAEKLRWYDEITADMFS